ncbi:MAG: DUF4232 domain-containing protein [Micrococcales bacterium]|nr:DUF4232 domain-containing protein [Micrococcales bacterium]
MTAGRSWLGRFSRVTTLLALAWLWVLAARAREWSGEWFGGGCVIGSQCDSPHAGARLAELWLWDAGPMLLLLMSVLATALALTGAREARPVSGSSVAYVAGSGPLAALGLVVLFLLALGAQSALAGPAAGATVAVVLAGVLEALGRSARVGGGSPRAAFLGGWGLVGAATGGVALGVAGGPAAVLLATASVTVAVAAAIALTDRPGRVVAAVLAITCWAVLTAAGVVSVIAGVRDGRAAAAAQPPAVTPDPLPPPSPNSTARPTASTPATTASADPAGVPAARPCTDGDLTLSLEGWDATMGKSAVTLRARNRAQQACWVEGFAQVTLRQKARTLRLTQSGGSSVSIGQPGTPRRVGIAPGASATAVLWWPGYRDAADSVSPQTFLAQVTSAGRPIHVPLQGQPAPFDLVDGGSLVVSAWTAAR